MRKNILALLTVILHFTALQAQVEFEVFYEDGVKIPTIAAAQESSDGSIIGVGTVGFWDGFIAKISSSGTIENLYQLEDNRNLLDLALFDDFMIVVGDTKEGPAFANGFLGKFDYDGNLLMSELYGGEELTELSSITKVSEAHMLVAGYTNNETNTPDGFLMKIDTSGNFIWGTTIESVDDYIYGLKSPIIMDDGSIVIVSENFYEDLVIMSKFTEDGDPIWQKEFDFENGSGDFVDGQIIGDNNNDLLFAGNYYLGQEGFAFVMKLNSDGNIIWNNTYTFGISSSHFHSIIQGPDNYYYTVGDGDGNGKGYITKIDQNGVKISQAQIYNGSHCYLIGKMSMTSDYKLLVSGQTKGSTTEPYNGYLAKFNIGYDGVNIEETPVVTLNVFPNPTIDLLDFQIPEEFINQPFELNIYSAKGNLAYQEKSFFASTNQLSLKHLSSGTYLINIKGENISFENKIIITK